MFEFRVTKYDPSYRDANRAYQRDDWTSISDIGRAFSGVILSRSEYQRVEDAYVAVAVAFLQEAGVPCLTVTDLENRAGIPAPFGEGSVLGSADAGEVVRHLLREEFWCRLEATGGFVHVGRDFYMYLGMGRSCKNEEVAAGRLGLFVEPSLSPYREQRPS